ncbi:LAMI_0H16776g1_1 [Lachancea mirantina]|uniref:LAMI_0H16776g1_1 n=1 Tax=Lachancea mirantina TaxID=1230905 RepID=A0A1G4KIY3_9SACH|nr:LAMI_0H16776g1_1 [Lachancea mirantina]
MSPLNAGGDGNLSASNEGPESRGPDQNRSTRNITVAIQYALVNGLAVGGSRENGAAESAGDGGATNQQRLGGGAADGVFVLNFTDVPETTTRERFDEVIALAAEVAMNRLTRRLGRMRGISKEAFDALPVLKASQMKDEVCSICYDSFEEEMSSSEDKVENDDDDEGVMKRAREEDEEAGLTVKRSRSEPAQESIETMSSEQRPIDTTSADNQDTNHIAREAKKLTTAPEYKHSPLQLSCGHIFGRDCIRQWTKEHNSCPICRSPIVGQEGLNRDVGEEDAETGISFDRIGASGGLGAANNNFLFGRDSPLNNDNPSRPEHAAVPTPNTTGDQNEPPARPVFRRHGFGLVPITFVNLHRAQRESLNLSQDDVAGSNAEPGANEPSAEIQRQPTGGQENDRLFNILEHLFGLSNAHRPQSAFPTAPTNSNDTQEPRQNFGEQPENRTHRSQIFNNLFRFARNLRNTYTSPNQQPHASADGASEIFNTGVASYRNPGGVSTLQFNREMPTPADMPQLNSARGDLNSQQDSSRPEREHPDDFSGSSPETHQDRQGA